MPFFPRTEKEIVNDHIAELDTQTNITQLAPGGKARFFLATTGREHASQHNLFDANLLQPYIKYSNSQFLEFFGDMLNLPRVQASHAATASDNFMFYVSSGTFGDLNAGSSFIIPAGRSVFTSSFEGEIVTPGIDSQPVITYKTTQDVTCNPSVSFVYVPIRAEVEGSENSVSRNVLSNHNFTSSTLTDVSLLKCTNRFAIDNGANRENDTSYRYRLQNIFRSRFMAVEATIRLTALAIPGVSDVSMVPAEQGPGTYTVFVKAITPTVSPELLQEISSALAPVSAYGVRAFVVAPQTLGLELTVAVNWSSLVTPEETTRGYISMRDAIESRLNDTDIGENLTMDELIDILLGAAPNAARIGRSKPNTFEEVHVHRANANNTSTVKSLLISDEIMPLYNERVLLETSNRYRGIRFITF